MDGSLRRRVSKEGPKREMSGQNVPRDPAVSGNSNNQHNTVISGDGSDYGSNSNHGSADNILSIDRNNDDKNKSGIVSGIRLSTMKRKHHQQQHQGYETPSEVGRHQHPQQHQLGCYDDDNAMILSTLGATTTTTDPNGPDTASASRHKHQYEHSNPNQLPPLHRSLDDFLSRAVEENKLRRRHEHQQSPSTLSSPESTLPIPTSISSICCWRFWLVFLSLGVANSSDASEILCLSYILSQPSFRYSILMDTAWRGGLLASAVFLGMLVGGLLVGALGDWQGRRPLLLIGLATNCFSGFVSAFAPNVWMLSFLRLIAGIGIGATVPPLFTLCSELAPPADRGFWVTLAASFWMVGSLYVALVGWWVLGGTENDVYNDGNTNTNATTTIAWWRIFAAICAVPSAVGWFMVYRYVPESPRFLALQGYYEESVVSVQRMADALDYTGPPMTIEEVKFHYASTNTAHDDQPATNSISLGYTDDEDVTTSSAGRRTPPPPPPPLPAVRSKELTLSIMCNEFWTSASQLYTIPMYRTTIPLQTVWFALCFGSYGLLTWINTLFEQVHLQNVYFNALLFACANLPGNVLSAYWMDSVGRTRLLVGSILASAASLLVFAYVAAVDADADDAETNNTNGINTDSEHITSSSSSSSSELPVSRGWIVLAACLFQCFSISAWNAIDVLTSELFPTTVRATGMGICAASGRIGAMLAQGVNGSLVSQPVRLLLVAAGTLMLGAITPYFLPQDATGQSVQDRIIISNESDGGGRKGSNKDPTATKRLVSHQRTVSSTPATPSSSPSHVLWERRDSGGVSLQDIGHGSHNGDEYGPSVLPGDAGLRRPYSYQPVIGR